MPPASQDGSHTYRFVPYGVRGQGRRPASEAWLATPAWIGEFSYDLSVNPMTYMDVQMVVLIRRSSIIQSRR